ncbi:MAG: type II secretion system protein [Thermoanaerobaculia bacterium]|nr:type II secretion system protein [Thermoanaerobaculia bacterium]
MRGALGRLGGRGRGFTMAEMVMVATILTVLSALVLPVAKFSVKRSKEILLQQHLRQMRDAIDEYKRYSDLGLLPVELGTDGYPADLETLVEGVELVGQVSKRARFLRRIPIDPMTGEAEWGLRSFQDDYDSTSWGGENVFDVYSLSRGTGMNGIPYEQW